MAGLVPAIHAFLMLILTSVFPGAMQHEVLRR
jgi:hypothetical protein